MTKPQAIRALWLIARKNDDAFNTRTMSTLGRAYAALGLTYAEAGEQALEQGFLGWGGTDSEGRTADAYARRLQAAFYAERSRQEGK